MAACVLLLAEAIALMVVFAPAAGPTLIAVVVVLLLCWLLIQGSRLAWLLVAFGACSQLVGPLLFSQPVWSVATGLLVLGLLLSPSSRRYFLRADRPASQFVTNLVRRVQVREHTGGLLRGPKVTRQALNKTLFTLGFGILLATPIVAWITNHDGGGGVGAVLAGVVSFAYVAAKVCFVVLILPTIYFNLRGESRRLPTN